MRPWEHPAARGTRCFYDFIGFEKHMSQIREQRGEQVPPSWYDRPYCYVARLEAEKMRKNGETLRFPSFVQKKDYEFEIFGMFLKRVKTPLMSEAFAHVLNDMLFCIGNDGSARDFQAEDSKLPLGISVSKGIADKAFGPVWKYGHQLGIDRNGVFQFGMKLWLNGGLRCDTNFNTIYFGHPITGLTKNWSFAETIAWFGRMDQGFEEGDLIGSGTVGDGCIAEHADAQPWLKHGDEIVMRVEGLGELRNIVEVFDMPDPR